MRAVPELTTDPGTYNSVHNVCRLPNEALDRVANDDYDVSKEDQERTARAVPAGGERVSLARHHHARCISTGFRFIGLR